MAKVKKAYFCKECGYESAKWEGKCPSCSAWNTFTEEVVHKPSAREEKSSVWRDKDSGPTSRPTPIKDVANQDRARLSTKSQELDRVLGGGVVTGSMILIGGQPGIGKSTLLLQSALRAQLPILYVTGEESQAQIKMRAERIGSLADDLYVYAETNISKILSAAKELLPQVLVIDSIQTVSSPFIDSTPGSISQVRECAGELQRFAKETGIPIFIIGHITKDGNLAGPKLLEHIVDVVLQFEGDRNYAYRILRTLKNRYGSTDEIGIYAMDERGLQEVENPSELLMSHSEELLSGSAIAATIEGLRPLMIETQALVAPAIYGNPQRSATGFDLRRLSMLLAVLEKRCGLAFGQHDVYLNMAGGLRVSDPSIDLSITASLISSLESIPIDRACCFAGEVGLSGEIRPVSRIEQRIQEAARLGFDAIYVSKYNFKDNKMSKAEIEVRTLSKINDLLDQVFA